MLAIRKTFWNPKFWLPAGVMWEDLQPKDDVNFTNYQDLYKYPLLFAISILVFRYCLERFLFIRLGLVLGLKDVKLKKAPKVPLLEFAYRYKSKWTHKDIAAYAKQLECPERRVQSWLRFRKSQGKHTTLTKFSEHCWRCFYYTNMCIYGVVILWDKPWLWDINHCWIDYPYQGVTDDVWWYYMVSSAFYWSLIVSQFFDVQRRDFWQMFAHHITTVLLLSFSWICNLHRIGSLVLVVHDAADCLLDAGKCAKYAKCDKVDTWLFVTFVVTWILTRLIVFPLWIIKSAVLDAPYVTKHIFPAYYVFYGLLGVLFFIHLYWTYLIFNLAYRMWTAGKVKGDIRSSHSENSEHEGSNCASHSYIKKDKK